MCEDSWAIKACRKSVFRHEEIFTPILLPSRSPLTYAGSLTLATAFPVLEHSWKELQTFVPGVAAHHALYKPGYRISFAIHSPMKIINHSDNPSEQRKIA